MCVGERRAGGGSVEGYFLHYTHMCENHASAGDRGFGIKQRVSLSNPMDLEPKS